MQTRFWLHRMVLWLMAWAAVAGAWAAGDPRVAEAREQAMAWLVLTDAGNGADSWKLGAKAFRAQATSEKWGEVLRTVRVPMGATKSRRARMARYTTELNGAPTGEYVILGFFSSFENKLEVEETVILAREDGAWKPLGYFIK